jgi:hypothetical protein
MNKNAWILIACTGLASMSAIHVARAATPPFHQCPAIGASPSCAVLITINPGGVVSTQRDATIAPYDSAAGAGGDDQLVGVINQSGVTQPSVSLSGPGIFAFDGDGAGAPLYSPTGPFGPTGYEGPSTSFTIVDGNNGSVLFTGGLPDGQTRWFSLEGPPSLICAPMCAANQTCVNGVCTPNQPPLNAIDVVASTTSGGALTCNGTADGTATGTAYSGTPEFGPDPTQNWRHVLALIYGGRNITTGVVDCNQPARRNLAANWSHLFQDGCANGASVCGDAMHQGALWHAFRLDDEANGGSDVSTVFASLIGLSPVPSDSALNGFGQSPFCNALNWDTGATNTNCGNGAHEQWTGPGGVVDPTSRCLIGGACGAPGTGNHRRPPPGTWGDNPDPSQGALGADVLPTGFQDNDPIRRSCLGNTVNNAMRPGEEVCNIDGALGLVLPIAKSDWMKSALPPLEQYSTNPCNTFAFGKPATVFTCAIRNTGTKHSGECPNGDALIGGGCMVPIDSVGNTSQCVSGKSMVAALQNRALGNPDGRIYNTNMRDGTVVEPLIGYAQYPVTSTTLKLDFAGYYGRIHEVQTIPAGRTSCREARATDQIACLVQADPCSIGVAGDAARTWNATPGMDGLRVNQLYPTAAGYPLACPVTKSCQF